MVDKILSINKTIACVNKLAIGNNQVERKFKKTAAKHQRIFSAATAVFNF